tara:strand:- start:177 stop:377 length:201 start_codon:yes stop_codon:yes gene_type:complete
MSKNTLRGKKLKHNNYGKKAKWLLLITSLFFLVAFIFLWKENSNEVNDLSLIGNGENIIVQIHDPG